MKTQTFGIFYRYFLILAIYLAATTGALRANNEVIATVNDQPITNFDLEHKTRLLLLFTGQEDTPELRKAHEQQALKLLIREMLQLGYVENLGIKFSDKEFDDALSRLEHMNNKEPGFFKKLVKDKGISLKVLRLNVLASYAWQMLISERFKNFLNVSDSEVQARLKVVKRQQSKPHVRFLEIVLPFDSDESREGAEQTGYEVLQHLDNNADFRAVAQQISQAPTAMSGGDVGWVPIDALDKLLQDAITRMSEGETSTLLALPRSFSIIKVVAKSDTAPKMEERTYYSYVEAFIPRPKKGDPVELKRLNKKIPTIYKNATSEKTLRSLLKGTKGVQLKVRENVTEQQLSPEMLKTFKKLKKGEKAPLVTRDEGWYITLLTEKKSFSGDELLAQQIRMQIRQERTNNRGRGEMATVMKRAHIEEFKALGISRSPFKKSASIKAVSQSGE